jgi:hypothetical protein
MNHGVFLAKLKFYGVNNMAGKLIKSYLTDRYQRTLINSNYNKGVSEWQNVKQGVLLGSIISPLIFLLYINDLLFLISKCKPFCMQMILVYYVLMSELVTTLKLISLKVNEWFSINSLTLNLGKTVSNKIKSVEDLRFLRW